MTFTEAANSLRQIAATLENLESTPVQEEGPGYKISVLDCHEILDELGIPSAKGQVCVDPKCKSPVGHRLRALRSLYKSSQGIVDEINRLLSVTGSDKEFYEVVKKLMANNREH